MRASGVSSWQLLSAVGLAGFALAVLMVLLGESLAPSLGAYASELRTRTMHDDIALAKGQSTWLRDGDRIVSLRRQAGDLGYGGGVLMFDLGPEQALNADRPRRFGRSRRRESLGPDELRRDVVRRRRHHRPQRTRVD